MALNQIVLPKTEQVKILDDERVNRLTGGRLHLFTNNVTVDRNSVLGSFTEAAWTGYASVLLPTWSAAAELGDGTRVFTQNGDSPTFTNGSGAGQVFFGYYLTDAAGNYCGAANTGSVTIPAGGAEMVVVQVTQRAEFASSP